CSVYHQSTEYLINGMFNEPISASSAQALSAVSRLGSAVCKAIIPTYKKNRISIKVMRASQSHQVPQVGLPQIEPVTNARKVKAAPKGAAAFNVIKQTLIRQTKPTRPQKAINKYTACAKNAEGTWIKIMR